MKNKNLSYPLSIYFLIAETILSVIIIFVGYYYVRDSFLESYRYRLQYDVQEMLADVKYSMDDAVRFTENLESDFQHGRLQGNPKKYIEMVFRGQANMCEFGMVTSMGNNRFQRKSDFNLVRSDVIIKSDTGRFYSKNAKTNEWIKKMLYSSKSEWSAPFYSPEIGSRVITYARPFDYPKDGKSIHATIFCSVSLDRNFESLKDQKMIKSGFSIILDEQNLIVYSPDSSETGKDARTLIKYYAGSSLDVSKLLKDRISGYHVISPNYMKNKLTTAVYWPVKSSNWFIITVIPVNHFISELKRITLGLILLILFIGSICAAVVMYLSIRLISPISVLAGDSRKIAEEAGFDPVLHMNDLEVLSANMEKMKISLASYRENSLQNSLDIAEMEKELELARDIEMGMVPTNFPLFPERNDFDCFGRLIPAKIVGGDLFDIYLLDENQLFISICDTLGKGIPAAMFSIMTRTLIRNIANPITRLGKIMESLNNGLSIRHESDMFATVLLGKLNLETGEFVYCNAGHLHPIILRNDSREEVLTQSHGIPVGVKKNLQFSESRTILSPGESLITFTDGVTEEYDVNGEFFGIERLISVIRGFRELSPKSIVDKTLDELTIFRGNEEVHDDTTLVVIKYSGEQKRPV